MKHKTKILITLLAIMVVACSFGIVNAANNFNISTGHIKFSDNSFTIDGSVSLATGTLTLTTGTLTVGGDWFNSGSFDGGSGSVVLNGTSQTISGD